MTISTPDRRAGPFDGTDLATLYPFTFKIFATSDLVVVHRDADGVETTLTMNAPDGYSVSMNPDQDAAPGGSITYPVSGSPLPAGETLTIVSDVPETQGTVLPNAGGWFPKTVERALDRVTVLVQQLREVQNRSISFPISDPETGSSLPGVADRRSKVLAFDADGVLIAQATVPTSGVLATTAAEELLDDTTHAAMRTTLGSGATGDAVFLTETEPEARNTLGAGSREYPIDDLLANGDFTLWTTRPAAGSFQSPGAGVGFTLGDIADGWYGGPGTGSQYTFTNPIDDAATGGRIGKLAWDAAVSAGEAHHNVVGQISASYWRFTFLEYLHRLAPEYVAGKTITIEFDAKASSAHTLVPIAWMSMGNSAWAASTAYTAGAIVLNGSSGEFGGSRVYRCTVGGTSAGAGGPTTTSASITDNTVTWEYVGESKGREYELYEAGSSATAQQIAWGDPVASARCAVTTSWQTFRQKIYIPELDEGTGTEYSGQANDSGSRTLTPAAGLGSYFGVGFDLWHNASTGPTFELRNVRVWVGDEVFTERVQVPRELRLLMANGFAQMCNVHRPIATQAQQEAATSVAAVVTPGRQHSHPSAAKFWVKWNSTGTTRLASYNVTSVTNTGVGNETVTIDTDFSSADWVPFGMGNTSSSVDATASAHLAYGTMAAGALQVLITNGANPEAFVDATIGVGGFGDQ